MVPHLKTLFDRRGRKTWVGRTEVGVGHGVSGSGATHHERTRMQAFDLVFVEHDRPDRRARSGVRANRDEWRVL